MSNDQGYRVPHGKSFIQEELFWSLEFDKEPPGPVVADLRFGGPQRVVQENDDDSR